MGLLELVPNLGASIEAVIKHFLPDPVEAEKATGAIVAQIESASLEEVRARLGLLTADAQSQSWLPRNGRWIILIVFTVLIITAWFGWVPANMPPTMVDRLFDIVAQSLGIMGGAAFAGRSVEKIADSVSRRVLEYKLRR